MDTLFYKIFSKICILGFYFLFLSCSTTSSFYDKNSVYKDCIMVFNTYSKSISINSPKFPISKTKSKYKLVAKKSKRKKAIKYKVKIYSVSPYQIHYASAQDLRGREIKFIRHSHKKVVSHEKVYYLESFSLYISRGYLKKNQKKGFKILLSGKNKSNHLEIEPQILQGFLQAVDQKLKKV